MSQTLNTLLAAHELNPPSKKDEDWLYYGIEEFLQNLFSNSICQEREINETYFMYVVNGECKAQSIPDGCNLSVTTIKPRKTNNSFIHLALKESTQQSLNATKDATLTIIYENSEQTLSHSSLSITNDTNTNLHIKRIFIAPKGSAINNYTNINVSDNSKIIITDTNNNNEGSILDFIDCEIGSNSYFYSLNQSYLSTNSRFQNRVYINGEQSDATLHGLAINETEQSCFYNTHIYHDTENSESHQLFKSMVKQNATLEYNGKVTVCPKAQQTNSYQLNQNILLDEYANVYSRPQLFIDADDVKCTHGSTTGDINAHEVLYLMSRGLDQLTSRKIVLNAFFEEVFNKEEFKPEQQDIHSILNQIL